MLAGRWRRDGLNPERIWRAEPPPPRLLVRLYPDEFGPEGREKARRLFEKQGPARRTPLAAPDDPRLKK